MWTDSRKLPKFSSVRASAAGSAAARCRSSPAAAADALTAVLVACLYNGRLAVSRCPRARMCSSEARGSIDDSAPAQSESTFKVLADRFQKDRSVEQRRPIVGCDLPNTRMCCIRCIAARRAVQRARTHTKWKNSARRRPREAEMNRCMFCRVHTWTESSYSLRALSDEPRFVCMKPANAATPAPRTDMPQGHRLLRWLCWVAAWTCFGRMRRAFC